MFNAILRFSVKKKLFVGLTTLFLLIGGIYSMLTLPIDAVPDITNNQVQIVTVSPTLAPQEVEQLITMPVEIAMSNIMNVTEIRSVSRFGLSVVTVVFKENVPTLDARQLVNESLITMVFRSRLMLLQCSRCLKRNYPCSAAKKSLQPVLDVLIRVCMHGGR